MSPDGLIAMKVAVRVAKAAIEAAPPKSENETDDAYQERLSASWSVMDTVPDILSTHYDQDNITSSSKNLKNGRRSTRICSS